MNHIPGFCPSTQEVLYHVDSFSTFDLIQNVLILWKNVLREQTQENARVEEQGSAGTEWRQRADLLVFSY